MILMTKSYKRIKGGISKDFLKNITNIHYPDINIRLFQRGLLISWAILKT